MRRSPSSSAAGTVPNRCWRPRTAKHHQRRRRPASSQTVRPSPAVRSVHRFSGSGSLDPHRRNEQVVACMQGAAGWRCDGVRRWLFRLRRVRTTDDRRAGVTCRHVDVTILTDPEAKVIGNVDLIPDEAAGCFIGTGRRLPPAFVALRRPVREGRAAARSAAGRLSVRSPPALVTLNEGSSQKAPETRRECRGYTGSNCVRSKSNDRPRRGRRRRAGIFLTCFGRAIACATSRCSVMEPQWRTSTPIDGGFREACASPTFLDRAGGRRPITRFAARPVADAGRHRRRWTGVAAFRTG